jgi:hypothetical protein
MIIFFEILFDFIGFEEYNILKDIAIIMKFLYNLFLIRIFRSFYTVS